MRRTELVVEAVEEAEAEEAVEPEEEEASEEKSMELENSPEAEVEEEAEVTEAVEAEAEEEEKEEQDMEVEEEVQETLIPEEPPDKMLSVNTQKDSSTKSTMTMTEDMDIMVDMTEEVEPATEEKLRKVVLEDTDGEILMKKESWSIWELKTPSPLLSKLQRKLPKLPKLPKKLKLNNSHKKRKKRKSIT